MALTVGLFSGVASFPTSPAGAEVRAMAFPVEGGARFANDFGASRSGGRSHKGNDLMAPKLAKVIAVQDGTITRVKTGGRSGNYLVLTDDQGWQYWYLHLNNDNPGTDDGRNPARWILAPGLGQGSRVRAGQHIAYNGDSGNAEGSGAHVHFEMHRPGGGVVNPFDSLAAASGQRELMRKRR